MGCLQAHEGPLAGRTISLKPHKPRVISVSHKGKASGELCFEQRDGTWFFSNTSEIPSTVNGSHVVECELNHGDELRCGRNVFGVDLSQATDAAANKR